MVKSVKRCLQKSIGRTSLNFDKLNTLLIEVESVINSRPLTYVHDDVESISYALCPSDLVSGRRISNTPNEAHYEIISTHETLTRKMKHHRILIRQFTKCWRNDYLLNLREQHSIKNKPQGHWQIKVGDVVILKNDTTKQAFWKLAIVESVIDSKDKAPRAAIIRVVNTKGRSQLLKCSTKHLYPIEVSKNQSESTPASGDQESNNVDDTDTRVDLLESESLVRLLQQMGS